MNIPVPAMNIQPTHQYSNAYRLDFEASDLSHRFRSKKDLDHYLRFEGKQLVLNL